MKTPDTREAIGDTIDKMPEINAKVAVALAPEGIAGRLISEYEKKAKPSFADLINLHQKLYAELNIGATQLTLDQVLVNEKCAKGIQDRLQLPYPISQGVVGLYVKYPEKQKAIEAFYVKDPKAVCEQMAEISRYCDNVKRKYPIPHDFSMLYQISGEYNDLFKPNDLVKAKLTQPFIGIAVSEMQGIIGYMVKEEDIKVINAAAKFAKEKSGKVAEYSKITKKLTTQEKVAIIQKFDTALKQVEQSLDEDKSLSSTQRDKFKVEAKQYVESQQRAYTGVKDPAIFVKRNTKVIVLADTGKGNKKLDKDIPNPKPTIGSRIAAILGSHNSVASHGDAAKKSKGSGPKHLG